MTEFSPAEVLRMNAEHFAPRYWDLTYKNNDLKAIRYDYPEDRLWSRIQNSWKWASGERPQFMRTLWPEQTLWQRIKDRASMAWFVLQRDPHLPDATLNGGCVITFWGEDGDYINLVQPIVGSLIADFLEDQPENPHAVKIAAEIQHILDRYDMTPEQRKEDDKARNVGAAWNPEEDSEEELTADKG